MLLLVFPIFFSPFTQLQHRYCTRLFLIFLLHLFSFFFSFSLSPSLFLLNIAHLYFFILLLSVCLSLSHPPPLSPSSLHMSQSLLLYPRFNIFSQTHGVKYVFSPPFPIWVSFLLSVAQPAAFFTLSFCVVYLTSLTQLSLFFPLFVVFALSFPPFHLFRPFLSCSVDFIHASSLSELVVL